MTLRHRLEYMLARLVVWLLRRLGPVTASNLGGALGRLVGPRLRQSRVADVNLRLAMPELDAAARQRVILGVWDNLGRVVCEMPHLHGLKETKDGPGFEFEGVENVDRLLEQKTGFVMVTGHFGNWEMLPNCASRYGIDLGFFYRAAENPAIDALINGLRSEGVVRPLHFFPKGSNGARLGLQWLIKGGVLGALVDQKMNDGVEARWFGRPAMTSSAVGAMAVRLRCPLLPVYSRRLGPARFSVVIEPPMALPPKGADRTAAVLAVTQAVNDMQERWVRRQPENWLWVHRRYDKALYRAER